MKESPRGSAARSPYDKFCDVLTLAEQRFALGDYEVAVGLAHVAARYAFPGHLDVFASPRLERLLLELGKVISAPRHRSVPADRKSSARHVLHVLTYGRPVGGDTRFVWRWIQEDRESRHSVAITTKGIHGVPDVLTRSAEGSGGFCCSLSAPSSQPLEQARELRGLCRGMDVVVLHLFPYDIIPILALAAECDDARTLFVNHSDHTFWIGGSVAHCVVHLRQQSRAFLRDRRGLQPDQAALLPTPLPCSQRSISRAEAKRALGLDANVVLLLTIASPFKYSSPDRTSFLDLIVPILVACPEARLLAVGPEPRGAWLRASDLTQGRIVPLGTRWDNDLLYAAADIYLDSVPFSSTTSLLEAGSLGVPLLGHRSADPTLAVLGPETPGLDDVMSVATDRTSYGSLLRQLIREPGERRLRGERVRAQIMSTHTGPSWGRAVRRVYETVERCGERGCLRATQDTVAHTPLDDALRQLYQPVRGRRQVLTLTAEVSGPWSYTSRLVVTWHLFRRGLGVDVLNVCPYPVDAVVRRLARWIRGRLRWALVSIGDART